jgi:hypothetical protein
MILSLVASKKGVFANLLNLEEFWGQGQIPVAPTSNQYNVFQSDPTHSNIVKPRLYRDHMTGAKRGFHPANSGDFMDIQAQAMSRSMKETLHPAVNLSRGKPPLLEQV